MNTVLDGITARVGSQNLTTTCSRDGCDVSLDSIPQEWLIVDADLAFPAHDWEGERCDFVVFQFPFKELLQAVPVELKSGSFDVHKTIRQIRKGAQFADEFGPLAVPMRCSPILIHGRPLTSNQRRRLNRLKIQFRGLELTVKTARCGKVGNLAVAWPSDGVP